METKRESIWDTIKFFVTAMVIVIPIRMFVAQPFIVSGESMVPTFHNSDYLIVDQLSYHFHEARRGDVIVFRYPYDTSRFFVKRVIGLPGETVVISKTDVVIKNEEHPKGVKLDEPYISHSVAGGMTVTLGEDEYFVMGDNRPASSDSRVWGVLPEKYIAGRALLRLYPFNNMAITPGNFRQEFDTPTQPVETTETADSSK